MVYLTPEGRLSIFCMHLGNACTQVRRSSVACKGVNVGLGFGTISLSSPPQRCPRIWVCLV